MSHPELTCADHRVALNSVWERLRICTCMSASSPDPVGSLIGAHGLRFWLRPRATCRRTGLAASSNLFTSQGCSSCPPADRLLSSMAADPSLVALSFPIDYWDFIGWKDTLAAPEFTARQRPMPRRCGEGRVYTPEAVVDGLFDAVGSDKAAIDHAVKVRQGEQGGALACRCICTKWAACLQIDIGAGADGSAGIYVLRVAKSRTVVIEPGREFRPQCHLYECGAGDPQGRRMGRRAAEPQADGIEGRRRRLCRPRAAGLGTSPGAILAAAKSVGL